MTKPLGSRDTSASDSARPDAVLQRDSEPCRPTHSPGLRVRPKAWPARPLAALYGDLTAELGGHQPASPGAADARPEGHTGALDQVWDMSANWL